jgi:hypothetical protein
VLVIHQMDSESQMWAHNMTSTANTRFDSAVPVQFQASLLVAIVLCAGPRFPEHHLLYGSDAFQTQGNSYFFPQEITELLSAVEREHLQVDRFFMMHIGLRPWSDLGAAVAAAQLVDSPDGSL